jgi:hypothetical protein
MPTSPVKRDFENPSFARNSLAPVSIGEKSGLD